VPATYSDLFFKVGELWDPQVGAAVVTATTDKETEVGPASEAPTSPVRGDVGKVMGSRLTGAQVWQAVAVASFAVVGYVTPAGEPRSSGVVYKTVGPRLYLAVAPDSWKAKHIAARGEVSVTVPVRRGGVLSLLLPIPPATVSFHASAKVHAAGSPEGRSALKALAPILPAESKDTGSIIEVIPEGAFLTYGLGVSLSEMRNPAAARGRVPAMQPGTIRPSTSPRMPPSGFEGGHFNVHGVHWPPCRSAVYLA
jgi:hypothetical protein